MCEEITIRSGPCLESLLPLPKDTDCPFAAIRFILVLRAQLCAKYPSRSEIYEVEKRGYDAYFIGRMNELSSGGQDEFAFLCRNGFLGLTTEYIVYYHFFDRLTVDARSKISSLLLSNIPCFVGPNCDDISCSI